MNNSTFSVGEARFEQYQRISKDIEITKAYLESSSFVSSPIIKSDQNMIVLNLSDGADLCGESITGLSAEKFNSLIERSMRTANTEFAYGRWGESRDIYSNDLFNSVAESIDEKRSIHLGIDIFCQHTTKIFSPLDGTVYIKTNNTAELDYGPMLIIEHASHNGGVFYTLYGHLSSQSIAGIKEGQNVSAGQLIAEVGAPPENGNWPPHLHFQLIMDLLDLGSDFPGVAFPSERNIWLNLSPCPSMFFSSVSSINSTIDI